MTKPELLDYLQKAVDALEPQDLENLIPTNQQPDLYTIVQELVGLRGEVRKVAQVALKTNHELQTMLNQQQTILTDVQTNVIQAITNTQKDIAPAPATDYIDTPEYHDLLKQIIEQDDIIQRTQVHFQSLPQLGYLSLNEYRLKMASWQKGYEMSQQKWQQFIKSTGIYPTGRVGDIFDPNYHEAIAVKSDLNKQHGCILETELLGFIRKEKIIRRAKVVVNKISS